MAKRNHQRGFTLVELMITVAIIGILAAIAIPTFARYLTKGKYVEAELAVAQITQHVKLYQTANSTLPPSTNTLPASGACASSTGKTPLTAASVWQANAGWKALAYHTDQPGLFQFNYQKLSASSGMVQAIGDVDCDGVTGSLYLMLAVNHGNVSSTRFDFLAAD